MEGNCVTQLSSFIFLFILNMQRICKLNAMEIILTLNQFQDFSYEKYTLINININRLDSISR